MEVLLYQACENGLTVGQALQVCCSVVQSFRQNCATKVSKGAKIRSRYNQVPHPTQDTKGKVTNSQLDTTNESMISVQCSVNNLLPNVAFSKAILSHENCTSHSMSILSRKYTYRFISTHLSKTNFAIASPIPWTGFIPIA